MPHMPPTHNRRQGRAPDNRPSAAKRGYDHKWQAFREQYIELHPLCVHCEREGRTTVAEHVHHVEDLAKAPHRKYDETNLEGLCRWCHNRETRARQG